MSEWHTIETAPPDERCLFWLDWADDCEPLNPPLPEHRCVFYGFRSQWSSVYKATHWMPLPKPPEQKVKEIA